MRWVGCGLLGRTAVGKHDDDEDGYGGARDGDDHGGCADDDDDGSMMTVDIGFVQESERYWENLPGISSIAISRPQASGGGGGGGGGGGKKSRIGG